MRHWLACSPEAPRNYGPPMLPIWSRPRPAVDRASPGWKEPSVVSCILQVVLRSDPVLMHVSREPGAGDSGSFRTAEGAEVPHDNRILVRVDTVICTQLKDPVHFCGSVTTAGAA